MRKWFGHDRAKWEEFKQRYFAELRDKEELLAPIRALSEKRVTLLFGASDNECNNAVALMGYLGTKKPNIRRKKKLSPNNALQRTRQKRARR